MRVLIAAMGSRGDVQPGLAFALALRAAGHEPVVSVPPDFAGWAAELGLPFFASGESMQTMLTTYAADMSANPLRLMRVVRSLITREVPMWFASTLEAARGAQAVVSCGQPASPSVAEKLGVPCLGVLYSPTFLRSAHHPPLMIPWQRLPRWMNSVFWSMTDGFMHRTLVGPFNAERARLGLPPLASVIEHLFTGFPFLLASDPVIAPPPPDWTRDDIISTGPWFYEDPASLDAEVESFLEAGTAPVYVGFGSMVTSDTARVTRAVLEGARANGRRLLLSKGWAGLGEGWARAARPNR